MYSKKEFLRRRNRTKITTIVVIVLVVIIAVGTSCFRFAFSSGSHKIIPTAIDKDFWGNYMVYYRTTDFTKNSEEDFYYIEKGNIELVEKMRDCIKNNQNVMVYYERYIGFKGITAPSSAPITKVEFIE